MQNLTTDMTQPQKKIIIPEKYAKHILCFDPKLAELSDMFKADTSLEVKKMMKLRYTPFAEPPTTSNFWAWFGATTHVVSRAALPDGSEPAILRGYPRLGNKQVARELYKILINPDIDNKFQLTSPLYNVRDNVNPYLYQRVHGELANKRKRVKKVIDREHVVLDCEKYIKEYFHPTLNNQKKYFLAHFNETAKFPLDIAQEALDNCAYLAWKD